MWLKRSYFLHIIGSCSYLLVLQFDSHHAEGVVSSVVVDVDAAEALLAWLDGHPLLTGVIVDHHRGPGLANALFTDGRKRNVNRLIKVIIVDRVHKVIL